MRRTRNPYVKPDETVRKIMHAAFPAFSGKQVEIRPHAGKMNLTGYWDEGSKQEFAFVRLPDLKAASIPTQSPYDPPIAGLKDYQMVPGVLVVEWTYVRGKRMTPRIHVHPDNMNQIALPAPKIELTFIQAIVLFMSRHYISSARFPEFQRFVGLGLADYDRTRSELRAMGLLSANKAVTIAGRNVAEAWRDEYQIAEQYGIKKRAFNPVGSNALFVGDRVRRLDRRGTWGVVIGFKKHGKRIVQVMWASGAYRTVPAETLMKIERR